MYHKTHIDYLFSNNKTLTLDSEWCEEVSNFIKKYYFFYEENLLRVSKNTLTISYGKLRDTVFRAKVRYLKLYLQFQIFSQKN